MSRLRSALAAVIVIVPLPLAGQQPTLDIDAVDGVFAQWTSSESPGCAAALARDGRVTMSRAYGMADLEHGIRNTPQTIFEAGSVSKQFTAAAIVLLAQEGRLSLDDDVRTHVPELPDYGHTITIRHLLTHTSGLRDWGSVAAIAGWGRSQRTHTHDHVIDILSRQRALNFDPGAEYSYSNSGYNLLAVIVDRVSGMSFARFSRERIFEPLGLENTHWRDDYTRIVKGRSAAYDMRGDHWVIDRPIENVHGNGGLLTTVGDLLKWNRALASGAIGGPGFITMMHERGVLNDGRTISYASGLVIGALGDAPEISHTGATSGYRAFLAHYPDAQMDVAVLCNAGNVNPGVVGRRVAGIALGTTRVVSASTSANGPPPPARPVLSSDDMVQLEGEYFSPDVETSVTVAVDGDRLILHRRPSTRITLVPVEPDVFTAGPLGRVRFVRDPNGTVTQLSVMQARVYDLRFDRVVRP